MVAGPSLFMGYPPSKNGGPKERNCHSRLILAGLGPVDRAGVRGGGRVGGLAGAGTHYHLGGVLQSGDPKRLYSLDETLALLVMGLALLWLEEETSATGERLFLLALPRLLLDREPTPWNRGESPRLRGGEVVSAVWPLLEQVPAARLQHCLAAGLRSDVPEVRACCRLLAALTATPWPETTGPDFGGSRADP